MPVKPYRLPPGRLLAVAVLLFLPLLVFHRPLLLGEAFLPADLLRYVAPWKGMAGPPEGGAAWNVLRYDGIAQFYPWRLLVARQMRAGRLPLWNPYQFGAQGGTPLLANSQSAPLYPPNALFVLLPVWRAFGVSAALHLFLAAAGTYAFARALPLGRAPALLGAVTFALCGPTVTWLALPTFLAVSCWLPFLLLLIKHAHAAAGTTKGRLAALGAGAVAGTMLLAGHLQVAFYCLLTAGLYAAWLGARTARQRRLRLLPWLAAFALAGALAFALAAPQLLPALELSRVSHRASAPGWPGYLAYGANALPPRNLVTLLAPDFFGHPNQGTYWSHPNQGQYAEWALYVGVLPVVLAAYGLALPWRGPAREGMPPERGFFAALAALGLLMALGTPVNLPFYFGVPGFAQTGSPARSLLLFGFSLSLLAALGLQALTARPGYPPGAVRGARLAAIAAPVLLAALGASAAARYAGAAVPEPFGSLMAAAAPGLLRAVALLCLAALAVGLLPRVSPRRAGPAAGLCVAVTLADLAAWGVGYNPTAPPAAVYPVTPGVRWLLENAGDALIAPINRGWSLTARPPRTAVLPPNALTVYGLHDLAGYDSLFPRAAKQRAQEAAGGRDPSPPENGNIVFVKSVAAAKALGARYLVMAPDSADPAAGDPALRGVYAGPDLRIYENPGGRDWRPPERPYRPASFRVGLFLGLCGVAALAAAGANVACGANAAGRRRRGAQNGLPPGGAG